jgi:hypothetical protein
MANTNFFLAPILVATQILTNSGVIASNAQITSLLAGTSTPANTFTTITGDTPNPNPILTDSAGRIDQEIWLMGNTAYKFILTDSANNLLGEWDNISGVNDIGAPTQDITAGNFLQLTNAQVMNFAIPATPAETANNTAIVNAQYPPGNPRRYGAVGNGTNDDTAAVQTALSVNDSVTFNPGDTYGVTSVTFGTNLTYVNFNGAIINGIATSAQNAAVVIQTNFCDIYDYNVSLEGINGGQTPNPNYVCASWWSNATNGTQFTSIFGCTHNQCGRGMVYGNLPGQPALTTIQSENAIYGWRTNGVANPFFESSIEGFIHFSEPVFFNSNSGWTNPLPANSAMIEIMVGQIYVQGGEMESDTVATGNAALISNGTFVGMNWECAPPVVITAGGGTGQATGFGVQIIGGNFLNTQQDTSAFVIQAGSTGFLKISDMNFKRETAVGATSDQPMIDGRALANGSLFTVVLDDTSSFEWAWGLASRDVRLVEGCNAVYKNHRLNITQADANVYNIVTPVDSLIPAGSVAGVPGFDAFGYAGEPLEEGWVLIESVANTATLTQGTNPGPPGFVASQVHLHTTAQASAVSNTGYQCFPGELFWFSCWAQILSGSAGQVGAQFSNTSGPLAFTPVAGPAAIGTGVWTFIEGPVVAPPLATFIAIGGNITSSGDLLMTDLRIRRAN